MKDEEYDRLHYSCNVCKEACNLECDGCKTAHYCSIEHQAKDWDAHKLECYMKSNVRVKTTFDPVARLCRRTLVARKNFRKGETVFSEGPLLCGPDEYLNPMSYGLKSPNSCIVCHKTLEGTHTKKYIFYNLCSSCLWPICDKHDCQRTHAHLECETLQNIDKEQGFTAILPPWKFILILRTLLLRKKSIIAFNTIMDLDIHPKINEHDRILDLEDSEAFKASDSEARRVMEHNRLLLRDVMTLLRNNKLKEFAKHKRLVERVIERLEWNSQVSTGSQESGKPSSTRNGIYPLLSAASHSCMPNVLVFPQNYNKMKCKAAVDISIGDIIRISKVPSSVVISDNYQRIISLASHFIHCDCSRCTDPTELGTYHSALKCSNFEGLEPLGCGIGNLLLQADPKSGHFLWKCDNCKVEREDNLVKTLLRNIEEEKSEILNPHFVTRLTAKSLGKYDLKNSGKMNISSMKGGDFISEFIEKYSNKLLHPNHHIIFEAKLRLCRMLSEGIREIFYFDKQAIFQSQISEAAGLIWDITGELIKIVGVLQPGLSKIGANILFYRQQAFCHFATTLLKTKFRSLAKPEQFHQCLIEINLVRDEVRRVFRYSLIANPKVAVKLNKLRLDETMLRALCQHFRLIAMIKPDVYESHPGDGDWNLKDL